MPPNMSLPFIMQTRPDADAITPREKAASETPASCRHKAYYMPVKVPHSPALLVLVPVQINASPTFDYEASKSTLDPALLSARKRIKSLLAAECTNDAQHTEAVSATLRMWQQLAQLASCTVSGVMVGFGFVASLDMHVA